MKGSQVTELRSGATLRLPPDEPPIIPGVDSDLDLLLYATEERVSVASNGPGKDAKGCKVLTSVASTRTRGGSYRGSPVCLLLCVAINMLLPSFKVMHVPAAMRGERFRHELHRPNPFKHHGPPNLINLHIYPPLVVPLRLVRLLVSFLLVPPARVIADAVVRVGLTGGLPAVPAEELRTSRIAHDQASAVRLGKLRQSP